MGVLWFSILPSRAGRQALAGLTGRTHRVDIELSGSS
jgi:hypothetical protein